MRALLVSAAILCLATACSGTSDSTSGTTPRPTTETTPKAAAYDPAVVTPEYVASLPRDQAEAAISSIRQLYFRRAWEPCPVGAEACLSDQFEATFDQSGELSALCSVQKVQSEYNICILVAAETVPMVMAAGGDPATDIDWSDLDSTNNAGKRQFLEFIVVKKCGDDTECIVTQAAILLRLSPAVAKSCQLHASPSDQMSCVSDAKSADVYQQALKSVP